MGIVSRNKERVSGLSEFGAETLARFDSGASLEFWYYFCFLPL